MCDNLIKHRGIFRFFSIEFLSFILESYKIVELTMLIYIEMQLHCFEVSIQLGLSSLYVNYK